MANPTDSDSAHFYFWYANGGQLRALDVSNRSIEWKAPQTPGRYIVRGSVGDGGGNVNGAYAILIVQ